MKAYLPVILSILLIVVTFLTPFPLCVFIAIFAAIIPIAAYMLLIMVAKLTPAWAFITAKLQGGYVLGILRRDRAAVFNRFVPKGDKIYTKNHGTFILTPGTTYNAGVSFAIAPGNVGIGVTPEFGQLTSDLVEEGANDIRDLVTTDLLGRAVAVGEQKSYEVEIEVKQPDGSVEKVKKQIFVPPNITGEALTKLLRPRTIRLATVSFDDLWKFTQYNVHPGYTDADIKMGIAQGMFGKEQTRIIIYAIAAAIVIAAFCIGAYVLLQYHQNPITVIRDNLSNVVPM